MFLFRRSMGKIQIQALGTAIANSLMFFIHSAAFGYGSVLVRNNEMEGTSVFRYELNQFEKIRSKNMTLFRVFAVITFGAMSVGR